MREAEDADEVLVNGNASPMPPIVGFVMVIGGGDGVEEGCVVKPKGAMVEVATLLMVVEAINRLDLAEEVDVVRREVRMGPKVVERRLASVGRRADMNGRPPRDTLPISPSSDSVTFMVRKVEFPPM